MILLPSGVGYADSNDVFVNLEPDGSATYLAVTHQVSQWIILEHFITLLKETMWSRSEARRATMSAEEVAIYKTNFDSNFVLLAQSLRASWQRWWWFPIAMWFAS